MWPNLLFLNIGTNYFKNVDDNAIILDGVLSLTRNCWKKLK